MDYSQANELRQRNTHLIGQLYKGMKIEDLVVAPLETAAWKAFMRGYILSDFNGETAILPFANLELGVVALFRRDLIELEGLLFTDIKNLKDTFNVT